MAFELEHCVIQHIPRTGGFWIRNLLETNKIPFESLLYSPEDREKRPTRPIERDLIGTKKVDRIHCRIDTKKPSLVIVRFPPSWYISYYTHKAQHEVWYDSKLDRCRDGNYSMFEGFEPFIDNVIKTFPDGFLSYLYEYYADNPNTTVGRTETLGPSVRKFIEKYEDISFSAYEPTVKINASSHPVAYYMNQPLMNKIMDYEEVAVRTYYGPNTEKDT